MIVSIGVAFASSIVLNRYQNTVDGAKAVSLTSAETRVCGITFNSNNVSKLEYIRLARTICGF